MVCPRLFADYSLPEDEVEQLDEMLAYFYSNVYPVIVIEDDAGIYNGLVYFSEDNSDDVRLNDNSFYLHWYDLCVLYLYKDVYHMISYEREAIDRNEFRHMMMRSPKGFIPFLYEEFLTLKEQLDD